MPEHDRNTNPALEAVLRQVADMTRGRVSPRPPGELRFLAARRRRRRAAVATTAAVVAVAAVGGTAYGVLADGEGDGQTVVSQPATYPPTSTARKPTPTGTTTPTRESPPSNPSPTAVPSPGSTTAKAAPADIPRSVLLVAEDVGQQVPDVPGWRAEATYEGDGDQETFFCQRAGLSTLEPVATLTREFVLADYPRDQVLGAHHVATFETEAQAADAASRVDGWLRDCEAYLTRPASTWTYVYVSHIRQVSAEGGVGEAWEMRVDDDRTDENGFFEYVGVGYRGNALTITVRRDYGQDSNYWYGEGENTVGLALVPSVDMLQKAFARLDRYA